MSNKRCEHGDDAPRNKDKQCLICKRERDAARNLARPRRKYTTQWRNRIKTEDPARYVEFCKAEVVRVCENRRRRKTLATGYTTAQAAELLALEMRDLLASAPELARIYQTPTLAPVRAETGYRWPRAAVDSVRSVMFGAARSNPSSHTGRFK